MTETIEAEVVEIDDHTVTFRHPEVKADGLIARLLGGRKRFQIPFSQNLGLNVGETAVIDIHSKGGG